MSSRAFRVLTLPCGLVILVDQVSSLIQVSMGDNRTISYRRQNTHWTVSVHLSLHNSRRYFTVASISPEYGLGLRYMNCKWRECGYRKLELTRV